MTNKQFKEKARRHQVEFKINDEEINVPADRFESVEITNWRTKKTYRKGVPNILKDNEDDSRDSLGYRIFYSGFRADLTKKVDDRQKTDPSPSFKRMITDLLRSEHTYNMFEPMNYDLNSAAKLFNGILGSERIKNIRQILIEYKEKNEKGETGLKDGTAFDVFVDYETPSGNRGGIGIEVKYTEKEYQLKKGTKEWKETHEEKTGRIHLAENYRSPSINSGWFETEYIEDVDDLKATRVRKHVVANRYRQIWRNHLLGASMVLGGSLSEFTSLTVYPEGNGHFGETLWEEYRSKLTDEGKKTFRHITYEELFPMIRDCFKGGAMKDSDKWVDYLERRYLVK